MYLKHILPHKKRLHKNPTLQTKYLERKKTKQMPMKERNMVYLEQPTLKRENHQDEPSVHKT